MRTIPLLRWKLERLLERQDAVKGSYDEQAVTSLFQALPKDELFCAGVDSLDGVVRGLLSEDRDHRVRVLVRAEPEAEAVALLVTMPSELYTKSLRERIERFLLVQLEGTRVDVELSMGSSSATMARFLVHLAPAGSRPGGLDAVAREVAAALPHLGAGARAGARSPRSATGPGRVGAAWADRLPASYRDAVPAVGGGPRRGGPRRARGVDGPALEAWFGAEGDGEEEGVLRADGRERGPERRAVPAAADAREPRALGGRRAVLGSR